MYYRFVNSYTRVLGYLFLLSVITVLLWQLLFFQSKTVFGEETIEVTACGTLAASDTTYVLQNDVTADGTCFIINGDNVIFDLNGKTVTFNNGPVVTLANHGFEAWSGETPDNWDITNVTTLERISSETDHGGWGDYLLKWTAAAGEEYMLSDYITLTEARYYRANAMFNKKGLSGSPGPVVSVENDLGQTLCTSSGDPGIPKGRGCEFEITEETDVRMRITLGAGHTGYIYVDEADIRTTRDYGIVAARYMHSTWHKGLSGGGASNVTVRNGTVTQGASAGFYGAAINYHSLIPFGEIDHVTTNISGPSTHSILSNYDVFDGPGYIHDNVFNSTVPYLLDRENHGGHIDMGYGMRQGLFEFYDNELNGGPGGFWIQGLDYESYTNDVRIHDNTIISDGNDSNQYSIGVWNLNNVKIYNNTITPIEGEGIKSEETDTVEIYNNTITFSSRPCNFEYSSLKSVGIRVRDYSLSGPTSNNNVHDNTIIGTIGSAPDFCTPKVVGIYLSNYRYAGSVNNTYTNNTITVSTGQSGHEAIGLLFSSEDNDHEDVFSDNTVTSNNQIVRLGYDNGNANNVDFISNTFIKGADPIDFKTLGLGYCCFYDSQGHIFTDTTFQNRAGFDSGNVDYISNGEYGPLNYTVKWYLDITVTDGSDPLSGAAVAITDAQDNVVYEDTTDANGQLRATLQEYYQYQESYLGEVQQTDYTPHSIAVTKNGYTSYSGSVTMDQSKEFEITLEDNQPPGKVTDLQVL